MNRSTDLIAAVAEAYRAFPDTGLGAPLIVCTCAVCMPVEVKAEIEKTPREHLSSEQIGEYLNSAHEPGDPVAAHQLRWLLPRILECCAQGPWPYTMMTEYTFKKFKEAGLPSWTQPERVAVREVFLGLLSTCLARGSADDDPGALIEAYVRAGEPVGPYLALWDGDRSERASLALAEFINWRLKYAKGERHLRLSESWSSKADSDVMIAWLLRPETVIRLQEAFFAASDPAKAEQFSLAHQVLAPNG